MQRERRRSPHLFNHSWTSSDRWVELVRCDDETWRPNESHHRWWEWESCSCLCKRWITSRCVVEIGESRALMIVSAENPCGVRKKREKEIHHHHDEPFSSLNTNVFFCFCALLHYRYTFGVLGIFTSTPKLQEKRKASREVDFHFHTFGSFSRVDLAKQIAAAGALRCWLRRKKKNSLISSAQRQWCLLSQCVDNKSDKSVETSKWNSKTRWWQMSLLQIVRECSEVRKELENFGANWSEVVGGWECKVAAHDRI